MYAQEVTLQNSHKLTSSMSDLLYLLSSLVMMYNLVERQERSKTLTFHITTGQKDSPPAAFVLPRRTLLHMAEAQVGLSLGKPSELQAP